MAVKTVKVYGVDKVIKNFNAEILKIRKLYQPRLYAAGLMLKRRALKYTPVDTSNLRNSCYVINVDHATRPQVEIGYTAFYAPYVHEMPAHYNFKKAGTGPKFLEKALNELRSDLLIVLKEGKLPK